MALTQTQIESFRRPGESLNPHDEGLSLHDEVWCQRYSRQCPAY